MKPLYLFDTTLRDGAQSEAIDFTLEDKLTIFGLLDDFGIDYIEGGWPGSNPKDKEFFERMKKVGRKNSKLTAFGSTRKAGVAAEDDLNLHQILQSKADAACIFGKSWDFQVSKALNISLDENLAMVHDSIVFLKRHLPEVIFDLEHFFDGYKANPLYAQKVIEAALEAKADFIVFCDTNGGTMPWEVEQIITALDLKTPTGIHAHNDCELGVSNSLSAIRAGVKMVQGTINGLGERCGNANLISVIANAQLKLQIPLLTAKNLAKLTYLSESLAEIANIGEIKHQAYTGRSAFTHKAGIHVSAIQKSPKTYEHVDPSTIGNQRRVVVSELSGRSNLIFKLEELGMGHLKNLPQFQNALEKIKKLEFEGYSFAGADASFELLIQEACGLEQEYFSVDSFRVIVLKNSASQPLSEATVKLSIPDFGAEFAVAEGYGPVDSLSKALKKGLTKAFPELDALDLIDYKVRILDSKTGTAAKTRVLISSQYKNLHWTTVGLSFDIIHASFEALVDSAKYLLMKLRAKQVQGHERMRNIL